MLYCYNSCTILKFTEFYLLSDLKQDPVYTCAFAKLRKAIISFVISVCPSVRAPVRSHETTQLPLDAFFMKFE